MKNYEIRSALMKVNMKQYELAALLGISEWTLSRKMRTELPTEEKKRILAIIKGGIK